MVAGLTSGPFQGNAAFSFWPDIQEEFCRAGTLVEILPTMPVPDWDECPFGGGGGGDPPPGDPCEGGECPW